MPPITVNVRGANHLSDVALILQRRIVVGTVIECGAFFCENAADQDEIVAESVGDKVERVEVAVGFGAGWAGPMKSYPSIFKGNGSA
jgi:hypothetical protein